MDLFLFPASKDSGTESDEKFNSGERGKMEGYDEANDEIEE